MARKKAETPAAEPVEIDPAVLKPFGEVASAPIEADHPALDPGPAVTSTDTQNAREMNAPAAEGLVPYSGDALDVTVLTGTPQPAHGYTGVSLLTTAEEASSRMPTHGGA